MIIACSLHLFCLVSQEMHPYTHPASFSCTKRACTQCALAFAQRSNPEQAEALHASSAYLCLYVLASTPVQVCGMWHAETSVIDTIACAAVGGVEDISPGRWAVQCLVCHSKEGAVIQCNAGHCSCTFHPLCARNNGQHLNAREGTGGQIISKAYCPAHSRAQRAKTVDSTCHTQVHSYNCEQFLWPTS